MLTDHKELPVLKELLGPVPKGSQVLTDHKELLEPRVQTEQQDRLITFLL